VRERQCALCGRSVEGLEDAEQSGKQWFCSPGHRIDYESRSRPRPRVGRLAVFGSLPVIVLAVVLGQLLLQHLSQSKTPRASIATKFPDVFPPPPRPKYTYRVTLTPAAARAADAFMVAEYVTHDCSTLKRLSGRLPKSITQAYTPSFGECGWWLANDRKSDFHLVRGSRHLVSSCIVGLDERVGASECFQYATEGRYITKDDGTRSHVCDSDDPNVLLQQQSGRWVVVAEDVSTTWGSSCSAADATRWQARLPWRN
jgi:hypothetical protein